MAQMAMESRRVMFVWLPNFAMTLARAKQPRLARPNEPLALLEKHGNIRRIANLDEPAIRAGLYLHQPLADALAVYPKLVYADAEPEAVEEALTALAVWVQRYSPATAPAYPCGLWLDLTGCAHLWGGEEGLAEDLIARLEARKIPARAAIAPTYGAAYALAHHAGRYVITQERSNAKAQISALLAPLPVERLRIGEETASVLRKLGLSTIGSVQKLPRAGLARRFPDLLPQLDKALGRAPETIAFLHPPSPWIERLRFAGPISAPGDLERVTLKLLDMLCARLEAGRLGGQRFEASFFRCDGSVQVQAVSTALPVRDAPRIFRLFREKLGLVDPGFGIDAATLAATHVEPLEAQQASILHKSAACAEELAVLIDALENRLGKGRIYRLAACESYIPERAVKRTAPLDPAAAKPSRARRKNAGSAGSGSGFKGVPDTGIWQTIAERPIRLFTRPYPIEVTAAIPDAPPIMLRWHKVVHRIVRADGPERISPEWWHENERADENRTRDYYRVESVHGTRFWVFREGIYGGERPPCWYLHGVFA